MIANAIPVAIRQYSIAVAPDWSFRNFENNRRIQKLLSTLHGILPRQFPGRNLGRIGCQPVEKHAQRWVKAEPGFCGYGRQWRDRRCAPVLVRDRKFTFNFAVALHDRRVGIPVERTNSMSAKEGGSKRNFIALVSDKTEEQRTVASLTNSERRVRDYILGLMAAVLKRHGAK
jgi:hypothetical protein